MKPTRRLALLGLAGIAVLAACNDGSLPSLPWAGSAASSADADSSGGGERGATARGADLESIEGGSTRQVFYQYVDDRGSVLFVPRLADVPQQWRDRVGFVEMDVPAGATARHGSLPQSARSTASAATSASEPARSGVILYSADWCPACRKAKEYMDGNSIPYEERNVDEPKWRAEMERTAGPGGIPVFDIDGKILRGFSSQQLDQALGRG
jgi:glutaredoxin